VTEEGAPFSELGSSGNPLRMNSTILHSSAGREYLRDSQLLRSRSVLFGNNASAEDDYVIECSEVGTLVRRRQTLVVWIRSSIKERPYVPPSLVCFFLAVGELCHCSYSDTKGEL